MNTSNPHQARKAISILYAIVVMALCACTNEKPAWAINFSNTSNLDHRTNADWLVLRSLEGFKVIRKANGELIADVPFNQMLEFDIGADGWMHERFCLSGAKLIWQAEAEQELRYWDQNTHATGTYPLPTGTNNWFSGDKTNTILIQGKAGVELYDLALNKTLWSQPVLSQSMAISMASIDSTIVLSGGKQGTIVVLDGKNGAVLLQITIPELGGEIIPPCLTPLGNQRIAVSSDHNLYGVDIRTGAILWSFQADNRIVSTTYSSDYGLFVLAKTGKLSLLDANGGKPLKVIDQYACCAESHLTASFATAAKYSALLTHSPEQPGIALLDNATFETILFVPQKQRDDLAPILTQDFLLHFPAGKGVIRAIHLPK